MSRLPEISSKPRPEVFRKRAHPAPVPDTPPTLPGLVIERELGPGRSERGLPRLGTRAETPRRREAVSEKLAGRSVTLASTGWPKRGHSRGYRTTMSWRSIASDETEEWLWLVIEYVPGGTLKDRLTEPLQPRDAARLMETIARAVGYFHTRGVCHLDLKPSNILLDGESGAPWDDVSPKISDFGIARLEGEPGATETGANGPKGTPAYMAPEQVAGPSRHDRARRRYSCPGRNLISLADRPSPISRSIERGHARPGPQPRPCPAAPAQRPDSPRS